MIKLIASEGRRVAEPIPEPGSISGTDVLAWLEDWRAAGRPPFGYLDDDPEHGDGDDGGPDDGLCVHYELGLLDGRAQGQRSAAAIVAGTAALVLLAVTLGRKGSTSG